jgi:tuberous sclerosis 1
VGKVGEHPKRLVVVQQCHTSTQTIDACSQPHEKMLYSLYQEDMLLKSPQTQLLQPPTIPQSVAMAPDVMLEQYIGLCVKKKTTEGKKIEDQHNEHIQLLNYELLFERHRREVHAERNRRLLGKSRSMAQIESKNETLTDQVGRLTAEISQLNYHSNCSRRKFNSKEEEFIKELNDWKRKYNSEMDENKKLYGTVETLQARLEEETKNRKDTSLEIERLRAELLDLRNDYHQAQIQAELGQQYRIDMIRLQHEMIVMGEIQMKCKEKLNELNSYEARDMQMDCLQTAYSEEIKGEILLEKK